MFMLLLTIPPPIANAVLHNIASRTGEKKTGKERKIKHENNHFIMCTDYNITIRTCKFVLKNVNMILNKGWNVCSKIMLMVRDGLLLNHRQDSCFENPSKEHHKLFFDQRLFLKGNITTLSQFSCSTEVNIRIFTNAKTQAKQLKKEQNKKGPFNTNAYLQIHTVPLFC